MAIKFAIQPYHREAGKAYGYPIDCTEDRLINLFYPGKIRKIFEDILPDGYIVERYMGPFWHERLGFQWGNKPEGYGGSASCQTFHSPFSCCGLGSLSGFSAGGKFSMEIFEQLFKSQLSSIPAALVLPKCLIGKEWVYLYPPLYDITAKHSVLVSEFRNILYTNHLLELRFAFDQTIPGVEKFLFDKETVVKQFGVV